MQNFTPIGGTVGEMSVPEQKIKQKANDIYDKMHTSALSEGFIALPIVYLVRLDELRLKKSFYKLFQANVCQS